MITDTSPPSSMRGDLDISGVLIDLDGVLYVGREPIPGAGGAVERLRARGLSVRFLTNTSTKPVAAVEETLHRFGIATRPDEVISSVRAAVLTLRALGARSVYLVVDDSVASEFSEFSPVARFPDRPVAAPDYIVVGDIGARWDYELMNDVYAMILAGAGLVALHKGRGWQTESGPRLDIGAFIAGLEYAAGIEAVVTGKPSPKIFRSALGDMSMEADKVIIVGDDIDGDIGGGQALGIRGVLVQTGKYRSGDESRTAVVPWRTIRSIAFIDSLWDQG